MKPITSIKEKDAALKKLHNLYKYANDSAKIEFANLFFALTEYEGCEPEPAEWRKLKDYNEANQ